MAAFDKLLDLPMPPVLSRDATSFNASPSQIPRQETPVERFIKLGEVLLMTGRSKSATYDDIKAGKFPKPIKLGSASRWSLRAVTAWMDQQARAGVFQ